MLNIKKPTIICKATDHIKDQINLVKALEKNGYTYKTDDGIYFDTTKFSRYADFAHLDVEGLQEGMRIEVGKKQHKTDFALWKFSSPEDKRAMEWDSPWGKGFPGWHVECSAMAMHYLGNQFDIHTGGVDHIPIHHTNEIAQSECATGAHPFVRFWMHGEFLIEGNLPKMSKSKGKVLTVSTLKENGIDPVAYRVLCLQTHYRKQLRYTEESQLGASKCLERLQAVAIEAKTKAGNKKLESLQGKAAEYLKSFEEAIANDLNVPQAFANLMDLVRDKELSAEEKVFLIEKHDVVLGIDPFTVRKEEETFPPEVLELLNKRNQSRAEKNWAMADKLRDEILDAGYIILDSPQGSSLKKK